MNIKDYSIGLSMLLIVGLPLPAKSQTVWEPGFTLAPYGWVAGIDGGVGSQSGDTGGGPGLPDRIDVVTNGDLELAGFMLNGTWRGERWTAFFDAVWANIGQPGALVLDQFLPESDLHIGINGLIIQAAAGYRVGDSDRAALVFFGGVRNYDLTIELTASNGLLPQPLEIEAQNNWLDVTAGAKLTYTLTEDWHATLLADVGAGDSSSSWQVAADFGYQYSWGTVLVGYRHMYLDYDTPDYLLDLELAGPILGVAFSF